MKRLALATALLLAAAACAGPAARTYTLWPTVVATWPAVKADVERGIAQLPPASVPAAAVSAISQIDAATAADDRHALRGVNWTVLDPLARAGVQARVDAGEISVGVSMSLLERIINFADAMRELSKP